MLLCHVNMSHEQKHVMVFVLLDHALKVQACHTVSGM